VGRATVILVNFHALSNRESSLNDVLFFAYFCWTVYRFSLTGTTRSKLSIPQNSWGLVALFAVNLLFFSSFSFVRKRAYSLFITVHVACVMTILYAVRHFFFFSSLTLISSQTYHHRSACVPFVRAAVVLYSIDHVVRIVRTRHTTGWLTAEPAVNRGTTLVHVPSLRGGWRAGQHVRFRVASGGWLAWMVTWFFCRSRPFTIAAGPDSGGMMLQVKALGSWSRKLLRMAEDTDNVVRLKEMSTSAERGRGSAREVRVIIEGPYGNY
jgi:ferric-chelate reductase